MGSARRQSIRLHCTPYVDRSFRSGREEVWSFCVQWPVGLGQSAKHSVLLMIPLAWLLFILMAFPRSSHATIYTASGQNCSHQQPLGDITKGGYAFSVDASCTQPLPLWNPSRQGICRPQQNLLSPQALGTWHKVRSEGQVLGRGMSAVSKPRF